MRQKFAFIPLSREETFTLTRRWQKYRDRKAMNRLLETCEGLVQKIVRSVASPYEKRFDDLLQEGRLGVVKAADKFVPEENVKFATYAMYWIRAKVFKERFPKNQISTISLNSGREDNSESGRGEKTLLNVIGDQTFNPEQVLGINKATDDDLINQIVNRFLTPREREIIYRRYLSGNDETLENIGAIYNISRERVRQIEARALKKIQTKLETWDKDVEHFRLLRNGELDPINNQKPLEQTGEDTMIEFEKVLIETVRALGGDKRWLKSNEIAEAMQKFPQFTGINTLSVGHACGKLTSEGLLTRHIREPKRYYALPGLEPPKTGERIEHQSIVRTDSTRTISAPGRNAILDSKQIGNVTPASLAVKILGVGDQIAALALKIKGIADILKEVPPQHQEGVLQAAKLLLRS